MKIKKTISMFGLLLLIGACESVPQSSYSQHAAVSFQVFYDELSPYGTWIDYPDYGYVWMPAGSPGFSPYYSNGYWAYSDFGWTWISYYPWGWAPFHYGRWLMDPMYGWIWVPDSYWGPAWVVWRGGGGYCGWAPLPPGAAAVDYGYSIPAEHWVFVDESHLGDKNISTYYGPRNSNEHFISSTSPIKNTYEDKPRNTVYSTGPRREEVQKLTGKPIEPLTVKENDKPGQNVHGNVLSIYRPAIKPAAGNGRRPAPAKPVKAPPEIKENREMNRAQPGEPQRTPPSRVEPTPPRHETQPSRPAPEPPRHAPAPPNPQPAPPQANPPRRETPPPPSPRPEYRPRPNPAPPPPRPAERRPSE